jgi:hypothetical protein
MSVCLPEGNHACIELKQFCTILFTYYYISDLQNAPIDRPFWNKGAIREEAASPSSMTPPQM